MDFLKLIRAFEELLFEVTTWLIYYPRTLWLTLLHPLRMIDYSDHEQKEGAERQYTDTLSPPLLLLITLLLVHLVEINLNLNTLAVGTEAERAFFSQDQNLILLRSFVFGLLPLFAALAYVRRRGLSLARENLRPPFFGQCYLAATYALMISLAYIVSNQHFATAYGAGLFVGLSGTAWYLAVQTLQFRHALSLSLPRAALLAVWVYLEAIFYVFILALILSLGVH